MIDWLIDILIDIWLKGNWAPEPLGVCQKS